MKRLSIIQFVLCYSICAQIPFVVRAQTFALDSLKAELTKHQDDTTGVILLYTLSFRNAGIDADTAFAYSQQALTLAKKLNYVEGVFWSEITVSGSLAVLGNYPMSLDHGFSAMALAKKLNKRLHLAFANGNLAECYLFMGDYENSLKYERECLRIVENSTFKTEVYYMWLQLSRVFEALNQSDSALFYALKANVNIGQSDNRYASCLIAPVLGNAYASAKMFDKAINCYKTGIGLAMQFGTETDLIDNYNGLAKTFKLKGKLDSSLHYARRIVAKRIKKSYPAGMLKAANLMVDVYTEQNNSDSTLKYLRIAVALKDTLFSREKTIAVQNLTYKEDERIRELNAVKKNARNQLILYTSIVIFVALVIVIGIIVKNKRDKQLQLIRNGIADDLHDDIGSTLSSISIMSELAKGKSPESLSLLNSIGESTVAMQENMSDIIWAIKAAEDRFGSVLFRMNQFGTEILGAKGIEFDFKAESSITHVEMTIHQRKNLFLFYKEVVNNAAKYSGAKNVSVNISYLNRRMQMTIQDNGKGFDINIPSTGNGMNSLKKRAAELDAEHSISSGSGIGTRVDLRFKTI